MKKTIRAGVSKDQCSKAPTNATCDIDNQEFTSCGTACPPTCSNPNPICTKQCVPGCQCPRGTVLDEEQNRCVTKHHCSKAPNNSTCDIEGQKFTSCGTACPPNCSNPNPICTRQCVPGCQCPRGTVLNEEQNECVRPNQCHSNMTCDIEGQQFNSCGSACPPTCSNPNPICTRQCVPGCQCPRGTVLDEEQKECVRPNQCQSNMTCDIEGQQFNSCGSACPPTCGNPNPICTRQCVPGCQCPRGTVLDEEQNECVRPNQCQSNMTCDIEGQQFNSCGSACPPTCSNPNPICTRQCVPGCQCPRGTVLDEERNRCVTKHQCSKAPKNSTCDIEGQKFTSCGTACPPTCSNPDPRICTLQCVIGCQCPQGTVLDEEQNKCVAKDLCRKTNNVCMCYCVIICISIECPPTCSHEYCSVRSNRRKLCSR